MGAGGLGSNKARVLVQMGIGQIDIIEPDLIEDSNRNRQFFTARDVGRPKAHQLLRNIAPYAVRPSALRGFYMTFEEWSSDNPLSEYSVISCGVDSFRTMAVVARYALVNKAPAIFYNVSEDGDSCRVFVQRPGAADPCLACYIPQVLDDGRFGGKPCIPSPAIGDILQVAVGVAVRAAVGEIVGVPIGEFNCRDIALSGFDIRKTVSSRPDCPLCIEAKGL